MAEETSLMHLVFAFEDKSESFVNGFELGGIWQRIDGEGCIEIDCGFDDGLPLHTANIETLRRMCVARGYNLETKRADYDEWTAARLKYVGTGNAKPRLSVVGQ